MAKGYKNMTEAEFAKIKALQQAGVTVSMTQRVTGRSNGTVKRVYNADTMEAYQEELRQFYDKHFKKEATNKVPETAFPKSATTLPGHEEVRTHYSYDEINLERIATALEELVVLAKSKKRLF